MNTKRGSSPAFHRDLHRGVGDKEVTSLIQQEGRVVAPNRCGLVNQIANAYKRKGKAGRYQQMGRNDRALFLPPQKSRISRELLMINFYRMRGLWVANGIGSNAVTSVRG